MAVAYQSSSVSTLTAQTDIAITKPTGLAVDDLMLAHIGTSSATVTPSSGFSQIQNTVINGFRQITYSKIATSGDVAASTFTFTCSSTQTCGGALSRYSGANTASPVFESGSGTSAGTGSPTFTSTITNHISNAMLVIFASANASSGASSISNYAVVTSNPTWVEAYDQNYISIFNIASAYGLRSQTTATGNSSFSSGADPASAYHNCHVIAISPPLETTTIETVTETDSIPIGITAKIAETVTETDTVTSERAKTWVTQDKSSTTWVNPDKT